jgi:hypothetical protein
VLDQPWLWSGKIDDATLKKRNTAATHFGQLHFPNNERSWHQRGERAIVGVRSVLDRWFSQVALRPLLPVVL